MSTVHVTCVTTTRHRVSTAAVVTSSTTRLGVSVLPPSRGTSARRTSVSGSRVSTTGPVSTGSAFVSRVRQEEKPLSAILSTVFSGGDIHNLYRYSMCVSLKLNKR